MSDETGRMNNEDRFFGMKTKIGPSEDSPSSFQEEELDIQVVDDRPEEDRRERVAGSAKEDSSDDASVDAEIESYGQKASKRMKKLKWQFHEERRAKEASEKLSGEAISYTQNLQAENQNLIKLIRNSQEALTERSTHGAEAILSIARDNFKNAHESGDSDEIAAAQEYLTNAQLNQASALNVSQEVVSDWQQEVAADQRQIDQAQMQAQPAPPAPDAQSISWQEDNPWFGRDKEMTSFAYGVHEKLVSEDGVDPSSQKYYELINQRMKEVFPAHFSESTSDSSQSFVVETATRRKANPVVAPAMRNNGAAPRNVTLTSTQVSLAKRIGLTPQQYAQQLIKEMS